MITQTEKFEFTIGVTEGYFHNNENSDIDFVELVDKCCRTVEEMTGIYVSFNIAPIITLYKFEWGCPKGGEHTYVLSAIRNPKFNDGRARWKTSCLSVMAGLKEELKQSSVTGEFSKVKMVYFN